MSEFTFNLQRFAIFDNSTNDTIITGTAGDDSITSDGMRVTIDAGKGDDKIRLSATVQAT